MSWTVTATAAEGDDYRSHRGIGSADEAAEWALHYLAAPGYWLVTVHAPDGAMTHYRPDGSVTHDDPPF